MSAGPEPVSSAYDEGRKLIKWVKAMTDVMGRGGKQNAADKLEMSPTAFSKLIHKEGRSFDTKTIAALQWIFETKAEYHQDLPVISEEVVDGYVFEHREGGIITWRLAEVNIPAGGSDDA